MKVILSRLSIRLTAPALLVIPVLLSSGVLITIGSVQGRAAVERLASQQLAQIHDQISQHVDSLVSTPARVDQANVALIETGRLDINSPRDWAPVLVEQFRSFEVLSAITWGAEDGKCTWIARYVGDDEHLYYAIKDEQTGDEIVEYRVDLDGAISTEPAGSFDFDPRVRPWYTAPKEAGRPAWSNPFLWVGGSDEDSATLGIAYGWPLYDANGVLIGVIDADLSLQDISRYLDALRIGQTGRAFLVDNEGLLLATSSGAALANADAERLAAIESEDELISASSRRLAALYASVGAVSAEHEEIFHAGGERQWLRATPFTHDTGLDWVIITLVPESDFMSEIAAGQRRSAWFTAGVTLLVLALGVLLATFMVRPIIRLSAHVRRLGEGDLKQEISLPYARELVGLSNDINQMTADLRDRMELRRSLALAMEVQQNLLPSETPHIKGLDIAGHSTYCDETGGDYYDYLDIAEVSNDAAALVVGDVMGHGVAAAMLMATARGILRSRSTESGTLGDLLEHLNHLLVEVTGGYRFMTMVLVTIDGTKGELRMASAGHDPPFIYDPNADRFIEMEVGNLPLGIMDEETYEEQVYTTLPVGAVVVASTDGVWEAKNEDKEEFGKDRLREVIRENCRRSSEKIGIAIRDAVQKFCGEARQLDDITFVVARRIEIE